ncbi:N-acetylneuraminate synthase family protein [Candidatus Pelagibacter sp.]|nr:N-acetylneuraminate synthase family protein [Candidatus Pelagibacter sp.]
MLNIICEIANGYYGNLAMSKKYIDMAVKVKSNAVKFQIAYPEDILDQKDKIFGILKKNEMSLMNWKKLRNYAKKNKIKFYLDIDGQKAFKIAKKINPDGLKISTTSFFDKRLLENCLTTFKKIYLSISGIKENEVHDLYKYLKYKKFLNKVTFLFGHQNVPTEIENTNLSRLIYFQKKYKDVDFGFMDHIDGESKYKYSLSIFTLGLGIDCFEKHLTISRKKKLIDSTSALEEREFKEYVKSLNDHKKSLGRYNQKLTKSEKSYREGALTVIHAKTKIKKNQKITYKNLTHKRALTFSKKHIVNPNDIIGKISSSNIKINKPLKSNQFK